MKYSEPEGVLFCHFCERVWLTFIGFRSEHSRRLRFGDVAISLTLNLVLRVSIQETMDNVGEEAPKFYSKQTEMPSHLSSEIPRWRREQPPADRETKLERNCKLLAGERRRRRRFLFVSSATSSSVRVSILSLVFRVHVVTGITGGNSASIGRPAGFHPRDRS